MPDDWSWFWAGESGRDNLLRDELEGLQRSASASSAQSARLSSQLRTLQGSIESRLQALSAAFDAYVELGDVREQLAGHPDTSAVRREVLQVLVALERGGVGDRVDARDLDYWLVDATNEVIALAAGPSAADGSRAAGQEHEMFVVAALGWLGHGERVSARVAPLLVGDGALAPPQVLLWRAVVHGFYGDVLDAVSAVWQRDLDLSAPRWDRMARSAARMSGPVETLTWVQDLLRGTWAPSRDAGATTPDDRAGLRTLLDALVGAGLGDERALLERARTLRARIENPGAPAPDPTAEPPRTGTTELVQEALLDPDVPASTRQALAAWVRPGLEAAAFEVAARAAAEEPAPVVAHTEMGDLPVGTEGGDPARLAQLDQDAVQRWSTSRASLLVPAVAAAVLLVVGLVLLTTEVAALGVFLLIVAVVAAGFGVRAWFTARTRRAELAAVRQRTRDRVEQARAVAVATRSASLENKALVADLARAITGCSAPATSLR